MWPIHLLRFQLQCPKVLEEITLFDLWVKVTWKVAHYLLHHVTYVTAKFEAATSYSLGGDAFTWKYIHLT